MGLLSFLFSLVALLGVLFPQQAMDDIIRPLAMIFWWFWRVLLSLDQHVIWCGVILLVIIIAIREAIRIQERLDAELPSDESTFVPVGRMEYWRTLFMRGPGSFDFVSRNLAGLVVSVRSAQDDRPDRASHSAAIPNLPDEVAEFVRDPSPDQKDPAMLPARNPSYWKVPLIQTPAWQRRMKERYYQMIDRTLTALEIILEIDDHE
jgi:hypothetical protein